MTTVAMHRSAIPTHALSMIEPWATLLLIGAACGAKGIETRSWQTDFRGIFAIHASNKLDKDVCREEPFNAVLSAYFGTWNYLGKFRLGHLIGTADLCDCQPVEVLAPHQTATELAFGDYAPDCGRFGFVCDYPQALREPIPARGMLNFWRLTSEQRSAIATQLAGRRT